MKSYKSLDQLVLELIRLNASGKTENASMSSQYSESLLPFSANKDVSSDETTAIVRDLVDSLNALVEPRIVSGLEVTASNPPDTFVNISSGSGIVSGHLVEVDQSTKLKVPIDGVTSLFYINFDGNQITIEPQKYFEKLKLGRIIVPNPGTTYLIQDDKPDVGYDGWVVSGKDAFFDENTVLDDDSIEILRDAIGKILADNLIGNIRLSEDLKITNTQGTLELDSKEMRLLSTEENTVAKFNRYGTFFYDDGGALLAKFGTTEARVGNIVIYPNSIQSDDFVSGNLGSGFQIKDTGDAEFNNIRARGKISTSVFEKDTVSSIGGNFLVCDSDILNADMTSLDSSTLTVTGDTTFAVGDILRIKDGDNDEWLTVTNTSLAPIYTVTRDNGGLYSSNNNPTWKKGTAVINYGTNGEGLVFMTASESNAPYLSILTHSGAPWNLTTTQLRLGNLNGFLGYNTNKYGIAIGNTNSYMKYDDIDGLQVKGNITITNSNWSHPNNTTKIDGGNIYTQTILADAINVTNLSTIKADMGSITAGNITLDTNGYIKGGQTDYTSGSGFFLGYKTDAYKFSIGNNTNELRWDGSALKVKGEIEATSGKFTGAVNVGTASNLIIDGVNECIMVFADTVTITTGINDDLDWVENTVTGAAILTAADYTPAELALHVQTKMRAVGDADTIVTYNSSTKKITIANDTLTTLVLQFYTGISNSTTCAQALGFYSTVNKSGALSYNGDEEVALRLKMGKL